MTVTIPDFLAHLPRFGEYPVPFTQMWIDGKPDFRVVDPEKSLTRRPIPQLINRFSALSHQLFYDAATGKGE